MRQVRFSTAALILVFLVLTLLPGCGLRETVDPDVGALTLAGLEKDVIVRRDALGIPVVEADNMHDLIYASGYVMASDRLAQMVVYSLLGQGRLAEMAGSPALDADVYIRTLDLPGVAKRQYDQLGAQVKDLLSTFSDGVNAYLRTHQDRLPLEFKLSGYTPEPWAPIDSLYVFNVLNLGLSFNLRTEIAYLDLAKRLGPEKAAWLFPVYPDEPLPFEKAAALEGLDFNAVSKAAARTATLDEQLTDCLTPFGVAASNNWAAAPERTAKKASIVANDTHLPMIIPPIWMMLQLKTPDYHVAGVAMPGIPGIVAGYNGRIAWGMTMVMGDGQDVFLEKLKTVDDRNCYLYKGRWRPVETRKEIFRIKGEDPVERTISATVHGPLLNVVLTSEPKNPALPPRLESRYGIALQTVSIENDASFEGMYALMSAKDMDAARAAIEKVRFMDLNFVYGDAKNIAWQVSGCYPMRKKGRGHLPSPGWTGEYDWEGYLPTDQHPYEKNPAAGYVGTANNRTVEPGKGPILGSSWYAPERIERIEQLLSKRAAYTWEDAVAMQYDRVDLLVPKVKRLLFESPMSAKVRTSIAALGPEEAKQAEAGLKTLSGFDGDLRADSPGAAFWGIFHHFFIRDLFLDELGPETGDAWKSYLTLNSGVYAPDEDHLLGREDSPFWDNIHTPKIETKADILAQSLADATAYAEKRLGRNQAGWRWGRLHTYRWRTATSQAGKDLPLVKRMAVWLLGKYTDRGPYPAGGDLNTLNVSGYRKGEDFDVWLIPAMRLVVDFGRSEPLFLTICGGQSGNPASPHYDDGIPIWLKGETRQMAFRDDDIEKQYDRIFVLHAGAGEDSK